MAAGLHGSASQHTALEGAPMSEFLIDRIRARARMGAKAGTLAMLAVPLAAALIGGPAWAQDAAGEKPVSYTHLRAHET